MSPPDELSLRAFAWPSVGPGDDLVALLCEVGGLREDDAVVVTSKVVAKAEGRVESVDRDRAIEAETRRVVARRGRTVIAQTRHGLVLAAAGVDSSNTPPGTSVLLPRDPDASARRLREGIYDRIGVNVAIVVSDTAGRAWRVGQTDLAIGCAGIAPYDDLHGTRDTYGNELLVTAPAIADELAGAADLVKGKATGRPVAVVRGGALRVLAPGEHGPGARALVRPADDDLFGLGAREAVAAASLRADPAALAHFPRRTPLDVHPFDGLLPTWRAAFVAGAVEQVRAGLTVDDCPSSPARHGWTLRVRLAEQASTEQLVAVGRLLERADALAAAQRLSSHHHELRAPDGWRTLACTCWWADS